MCHFGSFVRVTALDWCYNFIFSQCLDKRSTLFDQILYTFIMTKSMFGLLPSFFTNLQPSYGPFYAKISFSQCLEKELT